MFIFSLWCSVASLLMQMHTLISAEELVGGGFGSTVNCPSDGSDTPTEDCVVTCGADSSATSCGFGATINCNGYGFGNDFECRVLCIGDGVSGCAFGTINLINTFKSDVDCSGYLSCQGITINMEPTYGLVSSGLDNTCDQIPAEVVGSLTFSSVVTCSGIGACSYMKMVVEQNTDCFTFPGNPFGVGTISLTCDGFMGCAAANILATQNTLVSVNCDNQMSCLFLTMDGFNDAMASINCDSDDEYDANWMSNSRNMEIFESLQTVLFGLEEGFSFDDLVYRACEQVTVRYPTGNALAFVCTGSSCGSILLVCPIGGLFCIVSADASDPGIVLGWPQTRDIRIDDLEGGTSLTLTNGQSISGVTLFCSHKYHESCELTQPVSGPVANAECSQCYPEADLSQLDPIARGGLFQDNALYSIKNAVFSYKDLFTIFGGGSASDVVQSCGNESGPKGQGCSFFWYRSEQLISIQIISLQDFPGAERVDSYSLASDLDTSLECQNMIICSVLIVCNGREGCKSRSILKFANRVIFAITSGGGRTVTTERRRRTQESDIVPDVEIDVSEVQELIIGCDGEGSCSNTKINSTDGSFDLSNLILLGCTDPLNCDGLTINQSDSACQVVLNVLTNQMECFDVETGELTGAVSSFDSWNECTDCDETAATGVELTPQTNSLRFAAMSMVENPGFNVEDMCYTCDNSEHDSFCVELDIQSLGSTTCTSGTEKIDISVSAKRVSGDTDMFSVVSVGTEYVAIANDFDNGQGVKVRGGLNAQTGGVFVSPRCDNQKNPDGTLLTYEDDFVGILDQDVDTDGRVPNSFLNRYLLAGQTRNNWERLTDTRVGPKIAPGDSSVVTFSIENDLSNDQLTVGVSSDNIGPNEAQCAYNAGSAFSTDDGNDYKILIGADAGVFEICSIDVQRNCI